MGLFNNHDRRQERIEKTAIVAKEYSKQGKWYRLVSTIAIVGLFLAVGILVLGIMERFLSAPISLTLAIIAIVCMCAVLSLTWIRYIERGQNKILSYTMLGILGLAAILWIAVAIVIFSLYVHRESISETAALRSMTFIQIALVISFQVIESLLVCSTWVRYKKSYLAFQIIMYISNLFVDFWFSALFCSITFSTSKGIYLNKGITDLIFSHGMIVAFVLFLVYTIIAASVLKSIEDRKIKHLQRDIVDINNEMDYVDEADAVAARVDKATAKKNATPEEKLASLKDLLEKGLITEEEYKEKKAKIIDEM